MQMSLDIFVIFIVETITVIQIVQELLMITMEEDWKSKERLERKMGETGVI